MGEWFFLRLAGICPGRPIGIYENGEDLNTHFRKHNLLLLFPERKNRFNPEKNNYDFVAESFDYKREIFYNHITVRNVYGEKVEKKKRWKK